mgnify:FL=1
MKRAVVFAHYDKDELVDDYVIYYLKSLKETAQNIIFVSCGNLSDVEKSKLDGIVSHIIAEHHEEYDFGSYKRGFLYLKENNLLENIDELVLANDSCFGPFYPFTEIFTEMEKKDCDFWGITKNNFGYRKVPNHFFVRRPHIQSYFIVLKNNTFKSDDFTNFMKSIKPENSKCVVVSNYEIGLSEMLVEMGFRYDVYIDAYERINNMTIYKWRQLILKYKMPFMKCSLPRLVNKNLTTIERYQEIIKQVSDYPVELIENNVKRTQYIRKGRHTSPLIVKRIFFDFLAELPFVPRKILIFLLRKCFPFIRD